MMKSGYSLVSLCVILALAGAASGVMVQSVDLAIAQGGAAEYDSSLKTLTWSGGASGTLGLVGGGTLDFSTGDKGVTITGSVLGGTPAGSKITLTDLSLELFFSPFGQNATDGIHLFATLSPGAVYTEVYSNAPYVGPLLSGAALVDVSMSVDDPGQGLYEWVEPTGSKLATTLLDIGAFTNYDTQDYATENMVLTINAVIPEPATMSLLGMGALSLLRRRKR